MNTKDWQFKLVFVNWVDATQPQAEWVFFKDIEEPGVQECMSVGWVHAYTDDVLCILPAVTGIDGEMPSGMGAMTIPTSAIRSITEIKLP